ncbi:MAG: D-alanyl-D-alanine carboxypeptidase, partial [Clostridia bacterium]|nr:D-alanyl-D-alanine carboxypeptidase [Clostridia bacterium]
MKKIVLSIFVIVFALQPFNCLALELSASSAVLYEPVSGRFLIWKDGDLKLGIASTTKILTAITALEHGNVSDTVVTSKKSAEIEGSSVWLEEGEKQVLKDLLYALMLASGNDAAVAIAEHIAGSEEDFSRLMNQIAKLAGATNSNFINASGLYQTNHYSTAEDLARIMAYAEQNTLFKEIISTSEYKLPWEGHPYMRVIKNHNRLLREYDGCTGGKTGYTKKCGRCLVSSATRNGIHLIAVTINAPDDWNEHKKMLDYGFSILTSKHITEKDEPVTFMKVQNGEKELIRTVFESAFAIPVLKEDAVEKDVVFYKNITAPIKKGAVVGCANIKLNKKIVKTINIIT